MQKKASFAVPNSLSGYASAARHSRGVAGYSNQHSGACTPEHLDGAGDETMLANHSQNNNQRTVGQNSEPCLGAMWEHGTRRVAPGLHNPHAASPNLRPTAETYGEFQNAYDWFNRSMFRSQLPNCLITIQHQAGSYGFFRCKPFINRDGDRTDEISLNPKYFASRTEAGVLSTLVHEMAHLNQCHFGEPGRRGYHNRQWADLMIQLGLYPSNTGQPGGAETGYSMTHYIVEGGRFDVACGSLLADGFRLSWVEDLAVGGNHVPPTSPAVPGIVDSSNRWKYTCPGCSNNAWGKPQMLLICGACNVSMPRNGS